MNRHVCPSAHMQRMIGVQRHVTCSRNGRPQRQNMRNIMQWLVHSLRSARLSVEGLRALRTAILTYAFVASPMGFCS